MRKFWFAFCGLLLLCLMFWLVPQVRTETVPQAKTSTAAVQVVTPRTEHYQLQKVVIFSRHNIRAPLMDKNGILVKATPHKWHQWSAAPGELTLRGGEMETLMGQYFRKYLVKQSFMPENWQPEAGEIRFYANSMQRTVATARYFASGLLPVAEVQIEHKYPVGSRTDATFSSRPTKYSAAYEEKVCQEIAQARGGRGLAGLAQDYEKNRVLLEKVLDFPHSALAKEQGQDYFRLPAEGLTLKVHPWISLGPQVSRASRITDALKLAYYEEEDSAKAGLGQKLSWQEWERLADMNELIEDVMAASRTLTVNMSHAMVQELATELNLSERKFTFICGHDTNLATMLPAVGVEPYSLPQALGKKTPIGAKFIIEKWQPQNTESREAYGRVYLLYQGAEQLSKRADLDLEHPPLVYELSLQGLERNADGLYKYEDILGKFQEALTLYEAIN